MHILELIVNDVVATVYKSFGWSLVMAFMSIFLYLFACHKEEGGKGLLASLHSAILSLLHDHQARWIFLFALYTCMVLFRTLFGRNVWPDPAGHVFDGWGFDYFINEGRVVITSAENVENILLLMPFTMLTIWAFPSWSHQKGYILASLQVSFLFSLFIETCQLVFSAGTFQLSDLTYNTLGGVIGGLLCLLIHKISSSLKH